MLSKMLWKTFFNGIKIAIIFDCIKNVKIYIFTNKICVFYYSIKGCETLSVRRGYNIERHECTIDKIGQNRKHKRRCPLSPRWTVVWK